ncbi:MAG: preprotein translocase subunit SecE [candidate division WOR-3 bacterium]|nr:preprotein translocase subunit SecE [candidate division WOR-3 bacterium]
MKNLFKRIRNYLADVWAELKKVSWVKRRELFTTTLVVIVFSTIMAAFIGVFDFIFSRLLNLVLK